MAGGMLRLELDGRQVVEAHVRSDGVVVLSPGFDQDLGLGTSAESLEVQAFVAELAVERLVGTVLPGLARIDQGGVDSIVGYPLQESVADELRAVVGAQVGRRAVQADQARKNVNHAPRADAAGDIDGQAFVGKFIDDGQAFHLLPVRAGIKDEVVGPDVVCRRGRQWTRTGRRPPARTFAGQLQLRPAPQAFGPAGAHNRRASR
jgi:hypothetical protein